MFIDTGKHHKEYVGSTGQSKMSRLCKTCGYAYGSHRAHDCPGREFDYEPEYDPEFIAPEINKNTTVI